MSTTLQHKTQREFDTRVPFENDPYSNKPSPHNPNFQVKISEKCPHGDTKKVFKTGWAFYYHLIHHHPNESTNKILVAKIIDKIIQEKLK